MIFALYRKLDLVMAKAVTQNANTIKMATNFSILVAHVCASIAISEGYRDTIKEIDLFDDRLMKLYSFLHHNAT